MDARRRQPGLERRNEHDAGRVLVQGLGWDKVSPPLHFPPETGQSSSWAPGELSLLIFLAGTFSAPREVQEHCTRLGCSISLGILSLGGRSLLRVSLSGGPLYRGLSCGSLSLEGLSLLGGLSLWGSVSHDRGLPPSSVALRSPGPESKLEESCSNLTHVSIGRHRAWIREAIHSPSACARPPQVEGSSGVLASIPGVIPRALQHPHAPEARARGALPWLPLARRGGHAVPPLVPERGTE